MRDALIITAQNCLICRGGGNYSLALLPHRCKRRLKGGYGASLCVSLGRVVPNAPHTTMSQTTGNGGVRTRLPNSRIDENHLCPMA